MASKIIQRLVEMVEAGEISKDHPLFEGRYEEIKAEVEKGQDHG
jgi:hypothetical protein